jgi:energy-coupling factor transport system substrate-specific component
MKQKLKYRQKQGTLVLTLEKVKYSLKRKLLLITLLTTLGIAGRVALQFIPSVEPLTPLSIFLGFLFGPIYGFISGVSGFYASNFLVWGGQGPWTLFQCLGAGLAGFIGGIFGKLGKKSRIKLLVATFIGITIYEIIITVSMGAMFLFPMLLVYILTSIPFALIHLVSSLGFSFSFYELKENIGKLRGGWIEKKILGFRVADSSLGEPGHSLIPLFYRRETSRKDKSRNKNRFWHIRKK